VADESELGDGHDLESKLSDHKRFKKDLEPPFKQIKNLTFSSWVDERMPEMLWAVLVVGSLGRDSALAFFRSVADFVHKYPECYNVELSAISRYTEVERRDFIKMVSTWSGEVKTALRPLTLFPTLPAIDDWKQFLDQSIPNDDWPKLAVAVDKSFWHQSDEATDCRWVKVLCQMAGGKILFTTQMRDSARAIIEYPNYGDLNHVRPSIRASEIGLVSSANINSSQWSKDFWQVCFNETGCTPEEAIGHRIANRRQEFSDVTEKKRASFMKESAEIRLQLINHFFSNCNSSKMDSRLEGSFGLALFAFTLFVEIGFFDIPFSISGRMALRMLVETYITLKYLLLKEKTDMRVWQDYRSYGTGQLKLQCLKLRESGDRVSSIDAEDLYSLANDDLWLEFVPINLGHWDSANLRQMSEEAGLKDVYDKYYSYTSGYMHANWGAVRESVLQKCVNPLHRFHKVPIYDLPLMSNVLSDAIEIVNGILECTSEAYPTFETRVSQVSASVAEPGEPGH